MVFTDLIEKKKRGGELTDGEMKFFVKSVCDGSAPDYCVSAFLMAAVLRGMTFNETLSLTLHMRDSGEILEKGEIKGTCADKHSTGGVSDSTTLIIVPVCAALGIKFAKLSGRGAWLYGRNYRQTRKFPRLQRGAFRKRIRAYRERGGRRRIRADRRNRSRG